MVHRRNTRRRNNGRTHELEQFFHDIGGLWIICTEDSEECLREKKENGASAGMLRFIAVMAPNDEKALHCPGQSLEMRGNPAPVAKHLLAIFSIFSVIVSMQMSIRRFPPELSR